MLKSLFLFTSLIFLNVGLVNANSNQTKEEHFLSCEEVMSFVIENLEYLPTKGLSLSLAKKEDGYYLTVINNDKSDWRIVQYLQVWSKNDRELLIPELGEHKGEAANKEAIRSHFSQVFGDFSNYDFYKFYGYPECDLDIIEHFKTNTEMSLYNYELLARAHSNLAGRYFHPLIGGIPPAFAKEFEVSNYEEITPFRVEKGLEQIEKAMMNWHHIEEVNPNYQPHIISDIHLKIANEKMHFWSFLMSVKEEELARELLDQVEYSPIDLEVAKRLLDNCDENGFLLTNGDSDTFPLWYLQEKLNHRSDIKVMNTSLMQTSWYLSMCKARGNYQSNYSSEDYNKLSMFVVVSYGEGEMSVENVIQDSLLGANSTTLNQGYVIVPDALTLDVGREEDINLETDVYLYMWQLALLDIIISNPESHFFTTAPTNVWKGIGMKKHGVSRGSISYLALGRGVFLESTQNYFTCFQNQLDKMDVSQLNDSYLIRFEYGNFVSNLIRSRFLFMDELEQVGLQLIDEIDLDLIASTDHPYVVLETIQLFEELNNENGIELRQKYMGKARAIIASLDDSGANYLTNLNEIRNVFTIYSGESFYSTSSLSSYVKTENDEELLQELLDKLKAIDLNINEVTRYRTSQSVDYFIGRLEKL